MSLRKFGAWVAAGATNRIHEGHSPPAIDYRPRELAAYAELRRMMGREEAACLAMAEARGWLVASDEKRRFRREVIARLGEGRLVTTAGIFVMAIRAGTLSVEEADQAKEVLQRYRFRMTFRSFRDLLDQPAQVMRQRIGSQKRINGAA
jgi:hypothetical protein